MLKVSSFKSLQTVQKSCALREAACRADTRRLIWSDDPTAQEKPSPAAEAQTRRISGVKEMSPRCFSFNENICETNLIKFCIQAEQVSGPSHLFPPSLPFHISGTSFVCLVRRYGTHCGREGGRGGAKSLQAELRQHRDEALRIATLQSNILFKYKCTLSLTRTQKHTYRVSCILLLHQSLCIRHI